MKSCILITVSSFLILSSSYAVSSPESELYTMIVKSYEDRLFDLTMNHIEEFQKKYSSNDKLPEVLFIKGLIYKHQKNYSSAIEVFQQLIDNYSKSNVISSSMLTLGECSYLAAEYTRAISTLSNFISKYPHHNNIAQAHYWIGESYLALGKQDLALSAYNQGLSKAKPSSTKNYIRYSIAWIKLKKGENELALQQLNSPPEDESDDAFQQKWNILKAKCYFSLKQYDKAIQMLKQYLSADINREILLEAIYLSAFSHLYMNNYQESFDLFNKYRNKCIQPYNLDEVIYQMTWTAFNFHDYNLALKEALNYKKLFPHSERLPKVEYIAASCLERKKEFEQAAYFYEKALKRTNANDPLFCETKKTLAFLLFRQGSCKQAFPLLKALVVDCKDNSDSVIYKISNCAQSKNDINQIISVYEGMLKNSDSSATKARYELAKLLYETGKYERVTLELQQYVTHQNNKENLPSALLMLAESYFKLKDYGKAAITYDSYADQVENSEMRELAAFRTATCFYLSENWAESAIRFEKFVELYPRSSYADICYFKSAKSLYKLGKIDVALDKLRQFPDLFPHHPRILDAYLQIFDIYLHSKEYDKALLQFRKIENNFDFSEIDSVYLIQIARLLANKQCCEESMDVLNFLIENRPYDTERLEALLIKGKCELSDIRSGSTSKSLMVLIKKYIISKQGQEAAYILGKNAYVKGSYAEAIEHLKAITDNKYYAESLFLQALSYDELKGEREATKLYEELIHSFPSSNKYVVDAFLRLAMYREKEERWHEAYNYYQKYIKKASDVASIEFAMKRSEMLKKYKIQ